MHLLPANVHGNPNIGLYLYANDKYCLAGIDIPSSLITRIKETLKVPVYQLNLCGTSLIGVFCAGNSNCLLLPDIVFDSELKRLDNLKIDYKTIKIRLTALGNNILCNDFGALVNPEFSAVQKKSIRQALDVPLRPGTIAGLETVGSLAVLNKSGCLLHTDATKTEIQCIYHLLKIKPETGTVNMGNPFIRSGICANSNGFIISNHSGGPEITWADEVLGFLNNKQ